MSAKNSNDEGVMPKEALPETFVVAELLKLQPV
jgi:hypothetical protein